MRWTFQLAFHEFMAADTRTILLFADVGAGLFKQHRSDFPDRVFNIGICEQATISMAAGIAMEGLRPVVYTITPFLIERAFEQIKIDVAQMKMPVGLVGHSDDNSGPTHQTLNTKVLMSLVSEVRSYYPIWKEDIPKILRIIDRDKPWFMALTTI